MTDLTPFSEIPRPRLTDEYDKAIVERSLQSVEQDLVNKFDRRTDLILEAGKSLVISSDASAARFALGINASGLLAVTDYATGVVGDFVIDWQDVSGLSQQLANLQSAYETADGSLTSAYISADAVVAANADAANATLSATLTAADDALQANIDTEQSARIAGDAAEAAARESVSARLDLTGTRNMALNGMFNRGKDDWGNVESFTHVLESSENRWSINLYGLAQGVRYPFTDMPIPDWKAETYAIQMEAYMYHPSGDLSMRIYVEHFDGTSWVFAGNIGNVSNGGPVGLYKGTVSIPAGSSQLRTVAACTVGASAADGTSSFTITGLMVHRWQGHYIPINDGAGAQVQGADVSVLKQAFVGSDGKALARLALTAAASGNPALLELLDGDGGSSIALKAAKIFFGSSTVFEDTHNTFYTGSGGYRYRDRGPFGASSDLLIWYGPTSVALNSETKTNGVFAVATDGGFYGGPLAGVTSDVDRLQATTFAGVGGTTSTATLEPQGGSGSYTVTWERTSGAALTVNASGLTVSFSANEDQSSKSIYRAVVTDTVTGRKANLDLTVYMIPFTFSGDFGDIGSA